MSLGHRLHLDGGDLTLQPLPARTDTAHRPVKLRAVNRHAEVTFILTPDQVTELRAALAPHDPDADDLAVNGARVVTTVYLEALLDELGGLRRAAAAHLDHQIEDLAKRYRVDLDPADPFRSLRLAHEQGKLTDPAPET